MTQAIAGVSPAETSEVTIMTVWPSVAAVGMGRSLGKLYAMQAGIGKFFTIGKVFMLATIPLALGLYFGRILPIIGRRYRLTNRRVIVQKGLAAINDRFIALDDFDAIDVQVLPGQGWYHAGDLVFRRGTIETFRLSGVSRPEAFRQTCMKARLGVVGAQRANTRERAAV
ncbi:MAG: PH domain-containing protein [Pirellulales bacterium]